MAAEAWFVLGSLLAVNLFCRIQAERQRADEDGRPVTFRWWSLRLHPPEAYPTPGGIHYRNGVMVSALLFMMIAAYYMLRAHAGD